MSTNTAATVAISDIANAAMPEPFQIEIDGSPHRVDAATYEAIQRERADMKKKMPPEFLENIKKKKGDDDDDDDDEEYEDGADEMRKDAADQISELLDRCDANTLADALYNIDVLTGRFDGVETLADVVDAIDQVRGRIDALSHEDDDEARYDSDDIDLLLQKLDAATPADALLAIEGREFASQYAHMLPPGFKFDGQSVHELRLEAIQHMKPGFEVHNDSEEAVLGAFSVFAGDKPRIDSSQQLDQALGHMDMIHSQPGPNANRPTGAGMAQKPSESLFALSKAVRASGSK